MTGADFVFPSVRLDSSLFWPNGTFAYFNPAVCRWLKMKVLIDHPDPFFLAHGGFQIQIEQTIQALRGLGVDVELVRWWDSSQSGDVIHYFGRPLPNYLESARRKGIKLVISDLHTTTGSRSRWKLIVQAHMMRLARAFAPNSLLYRLSWETYRQCDACILLSPWEASLVRRFYSPAEEKIHIVPNGIDPVFVKSPTAKRGKWLVTTATVTERQRVLETAEAAVAAQTPYWVVGKPFSESDPYYSRWIALCKKYPEWLRYEGPINDWVKLAAVYQEARGFVLLSFAESLSLSALEAAACGCPLLLANLPWAKTYFGKNASYCPITGTAPTASRLRWFYDNAPNLPVPPPQKTWREVGVLLKAIYESVCKVP